MRPAVTGLTGMRAGVAEIRGLSPGVTGLTGMRVDGVARMTGMMSAVAAKHTKVVVMRTTVAATGAGKNTKVATAVAGIYSYCHWYGQAHQDHSLATGDLLCLGKIFTLLPGSTPSIIFEIGEHSAVSTPSTIAR